MSPETVTLIGNSRFCFLWMLREEIHLGKPECVWLRGAHFWRVFTSCLVKSWCLRWGQPSQLVCQGGGAIWIHYERLGSLSLSASEEVISLSLSLIIPLRRRTGEVRGTSGSSGREWESGKERERRRCRRTVFQPWLWLLLLLLSPVWGGGKDTHAGFLPNTAETFMKSLQRQGRQALFLSPNWFSCSRCCASDFIAAGPPPCCPHSLLPLDLETYLQLGAAPSLLALTGLGPGRTPARYW